MFSIDCENYTLNGMSNTFGAEKTVETTDNKEIRATFTIVCSNEEDNNSFNFEYYGDDEFAVEKDRCEINVYIKENKTPYDKNFTVICRHANDNTLYVQIEIIQKSDEYKLEITGGAQNIGENKYSKQLKSVIEEKFSGTSADLNYNYYEECEFQIDVLGGSRKYRIESILKCHEDTENENQTSYYSFDNGFICNKFADKLKIISYGRPFLDENDYYLIKLCHEDYREVTVELKITYEKQQNVAGRRLLRTGRKKKPIPKQISEIYMPYDTFMERLETERQSQIEQNNVECNIVFKEEIGDEYVIDGKKHETVIPFDVYENGELSNLMVKVHATGSWCSASTDATNRNLILRMNNYSAFERKAFVNITIIDYPETFKTFVLVNKPK